jgi:predicted nucleotidyltransferase
LCEVPAKDVKRHYVPVERLRELRKSGRLDALEGKALQLAELVKENANIKWNALGISGSILAELHKSTSDIDPIIYGSKSCWKVYTALGTLLNDERCPFKRYGAEDLRILFDFRSKDTEIGYESFCSN